MARIKYILNERRLALIAAAAPNTPNAAHTLPPFSSITNRSDPLSAAEALATPDEAVRTDILRSVISETAKTEADELPEDGVAQEEVESKDQGYGGGKEAEEFVQDKVPGVDDVKKA